MRGQKKIAIIGTSIILVVVLLIVLCVYFGAGQRKLYGLLDLGQRYLDKLAYEDAIVVFDEAIAIDPKCERAYMGKAEAQYALGQYEDLIDTLIEGIEKVHDSTELENFQQQIYDELFETEANKKTIFEVESKSEYTIEEREMEGNAAFLKQVLEAWENGGIHEVVVLTNQSKLYHELKESITEGESFYYGEYDNEGKRSGIGVAAYKIHDEWEPSYEFIYFYIGEWKEGKREGQGDWFYIQGAHYKCSWVNDMPEGNVKWYEDGYEGSYIYCWEGTVVHGMFDGMLSGTWHRSDAPSCFISYSNGHLDYFYISFFGDYAVEKNISSTNEISYSGLTKEKYEMYEHITHGVAGFADTHYQMKAGDVQGNMAIGKR